MKQMAVPHEVTQNIARAKHLIHRNEPARSLEALLAALEAYEPRSVVGQARVVVEVHLRECLADINSHPVIRELLETLTNSSTVTLSYKPGEEKRLQLVLSLLHKALGQVQASRQRENEEAVKNRKQALLERGSQLMAAGELPRGKAVLRKYAEEFGREPGVMATVGSLFRKAGLPTDAAEILEAAVRAYPKDATAYADLVSCYMELKEYEKAEKTYLAVIRAFGKHPRTMVSMARMYIAWNKKDKAFHLLNEVCSKDPANTEAAGLLAQVE